MHNSINGLNVNKAQYEAIIHREGPALVIAGPGSGKTTVITQRIKYLIEHHHVKPEEILVITFTKTAAAEMRERFLTIMNSDSSNVSFGTFHAIYFHILKQAYQYQKSNILTETEKYRFLKETMQSIEYTSQSAIEDSLLQNEYIHLLLQEFSKIKNEGRDVREYNSQVLEPSLFRQVYARYHKILYEHRKLDFDDMVLQCYQLFEQREDILKGWRQRFQYILIDEFQDICPMQFAVIRQLSAPHNNLFIVGDDDQSIYSFRGASPAIMLDFPHLYPEAKKILLNVNYRCHEDIVKASISLISHNQQRFSKEIIPHIKGDTTNRHIDYHTYPDDAGQCQDIIDYINEHVKKGGSYSDIAILYRTNIGASKMAERCIAFNIPFEMKEKVQNIYNRFFMQDILAYIRFALGERRRVLFYQFMNKPVRYIQRNALKDETVCMDELIEYYRDKEYVSRAVVQLRMQLILMKEMSPFAAINYIRKGIGYDSYLQKLAEGSIETFIEWMEQLDEIQKLARTFETLTEWLQYIDEYSEELKKIKKVKGDAIEIMTMHAAKGLEWKKVWIPDLNEGVIPHKKAVFPEDMEEERRMLYVAMTRAKEQLILSAVTPQKESAEQEKKCIESRFLKEIEFISEESSH